MTPDLPTRVREAFEGELAKCADFYSDCCEEHQDAALAAVIAVVQEDRTREIVEHVRSWGDGEMAGPQGRHLANAFAATIEAKFGGTTHD